MTSSHIPSSFLGRIGQVAKWLILGLLALQFVVAGALKLIPSNGMVQMFALFGYDGLPWIRISVGIVEVVGGPLLLFKRTRFAAALVTGLLIALGMLDVLRRYAGRLGGLPQPIRDVAAPAAVTVLSLLLIACLSRSRDARRTDARAARAT